MVGPTYVEDMRTEYGVDSPIYAAKVLGEFPLDSDDGVVAYSKLKRCSAPEPIPAPRRNSPGSSSAWTWGRRDTKRLSGTPRHGRLATAGGRHAQDAMPQRG